MINDVTDSFGDWLENVTGERAASGGYYDDAGDWVTGGSAVALSFIGVVQNTNPEDLLVLAEGQRTDEAIKIHTTTELIIQTQSSTGDTISYDGKTWLVTWVADRKIGNYYKAIAIKQ